MSKATTNKPSTLPIGYLHHALQKVRVHTTPLLETKVEDHILKAAYHHQTDTVSLSLNGYKLNEADGQNSEEIVIAYNQLIRALNNLKPKRNEQETKTTKRT